MFIKLFPKDYKSYSDETWNKLALRDDNSDSSIHPYLTDLYFKVH